MPGLLRTGPVVGRGPGCLLVDSHIPFAVALLKVARHEFLPCSVPLAAT